MYGLMYTFNKEDVIKYDLDYYLDDAEFDAVGFTVTANTFWIVF
jgi:hypothetical protein